MDVILQVRKGKNLDITELGQDLLEAISTLFSTDDLSLISSIDDIKDYLQNRIIFKISRTA